MAPSSEEHRSMFMIWKKIESATESERRTGISQNEVDTNFQSKAVVSASDPISLSYSASVSGVSNVKDGLPSPFKNMLTWPSAPLPSQKKRSIRGPPIPSVITSKQWQDYHIRKNKDKQDLEDAKKKRAEERQRKKQDREERKKADMEKKKKAKEENLKKKKERKRRREISSSSEEWHASDHSSCEEMDSLNNNNPIDADNHTLQVLESDGNSDSELVTTQIILDGEVNRENTRILESMGILDSDLTTPPAIILESEENHVKEILFGGGYALSVVPLFHNNDLGERVIYAKSIFIFLVWDLQ